LAPYTFRAVVLRSDKREFVFQGTIDIASMKIWLRHPAKQDPADTIQQTRSSRHGLADTA
jgi:hypothetical protein